MSHRPVCRTTTLLALTILFAAPTIATQDAKTESADKPKPKPKVKLPPAKEIIEKFIKATGGRQARLKHKSSHAKGTMSMPAMGMSGPLEVFAAAPNRLALKIELPGMGIIREGFDGKVGWEVQPMMGPSVHEGVRLEQTRIAADYYSDLNKAKLYKSIETVELTEFEGRKCYKIKLTPKIGPPAFEFYEVEAGLRRGSQLTLITPMGEMPVTVVESDYKKFGDLTLASKTIQKIMMQEIVITIDSIEHDNVDPSVFELPAEIKALTQTKKSEDQDSKSKKPNTENAGKP